MSRPNLIERIAAWFTTRWRQDPKDHGKSWDLVYRGQPIATVWANGAWAVWSGDMIYVDGQKAAAMSTAMYGGASRGGNLSRRARIRRAKRRALEACFEVGRL